MKVLIVSDTHKYNRNFYEALPQTYPGLCVALSRLGINPMGPSELMPFTPELYLACYRLRGFILRWGKSQLAVGNIPIVLEAGEDGTFLLWAGEMVLPWVQQESKDEVVSPANMPEFLERMRHTWFLRHEQETLSS